MGKKKKRAPAQAEMVEMFDRTPEESRAMIDEDRMEDPNQSKKEVTANTDDEGNPIAVKNSIHLAKRPTAQMEADRAAYMKEKEANYVRDDMAANAESRKKSNDAITEREYAARIKALKALKAKRKESIYNRDGTARYMKEDGTLEPRK